MTDEEHQAQLDAAQAEVSALAAAAFEELMQRLRDGQAPKEALAAVTATFQGEYVDALAREFGRLLGRTVSSEEIHAMPIGDLKLSDKLYRQASETSAVARTIIQNHLQAFQDARELALQLYEGYQFKDDPLKVRAALPKYLREAMRDPAIDSGLRQLFAKIRAGNLKTPGLRAAYLQALNAIEKGAGEARLRKMLKIAWYERNRYFANRIAQTELHSAYETEKAVEFMADDSLHWVQVRMSKTHPRMDICDLHSKLDKYGMGPGVYPKAEAPKPTFHPFCRCVVNPRWDLEGEAKPRQHAERAFFEALPAGEGRKVAGSHDRLQRILAGEDWEKVIDGNADPLYRFRRVGESDRSRLIEQAWNTMNLPSAKNLRAMAGVVAAAPEMLKGANSVDEALQRLRDVLGVPPGGRRTITTPAGNVILEDSWLPHLVEKREAARERYANWIIPTLEHPTEVWLTPHSSSESRKRFIKLFSEGGKEMLVIVSLENGDVLWNAIPMPTRSLDNQRKGKLLWKSYR